MNPSIVPNSRVAFLSGMIAICMFAARPALAASPDASLYTLRFKVYDVRSFGISGNGRANLIEGDKIHGMEFVFDCGPISPSDGSDSYPAKWKKPEQSLDILIPVVGSANKTRNCEVKVTTKSYIFDVSGDGHLVTITQEQWSARQAYRMLRAADLAPEDKDLAHYPLRISVLTLRWNAAIEGVFIGTGQGNLLTATGPAAMDFTVTCPLRFTATPEGRYYSAQWKHENSDLVLYLRGPLNGDATPVATCDFKTVIGKDIYALQSDGVVKSISPEEYQRLKKASTTP